MSSGGLRPLRPGEILDAAIKLYVRNARVLMGASAVVVVPLQLLSAVVLLSVYSSGKEIPTGFANVGSSVPQPDVAARLGATAITGVIGLISAVLVTATCVKAVSDLYVDQQTTVATSLRFAARRLLPLLGMDILLGLGEAFGLILLIIPGIWLYIAWSVATPALLVERLGPTAALGRSRRLIKGRWWPAFGVLLLATIIAGLVGGAITGLLTAVALQSSNPSVLFAVTISTAAAIVSEILVRPFNATVTTVLYFDLRIRREGYDLQVMADQLGLPESAMPSLPAGSGGTFGPQDVGKPGGPPYWPPPPNWQPGQ